MQRKNTPIDDTRESVSEIRSLIHQASLCELSREELESMKNYLTDKIRTVEGPKE